MSFDGFRKAQARARPLAGRGQAARAAPCALGPGRWAMSRRCAPSSTSLHETLGGRPIDLAVASEAGMAAVEAAIDAECARRAAATPSSGQVSRR